MTPTKVILTITTIWGLFLSIIVYSQTTNVVVLDSGEIVTLREVIAGNSRAAMLYDSVANLAHQHLSDAPRPLERLYYEGLLNNNPDRIDTRKSLEDMDKVIDFIYASYGRSQDTLTQKIRQFVLAWASTYQPTGNPINENKFVALFWGYYLFQSHFSEDERALVNRWMIDMAEQEMNREHTPNNNWQSKRYKIIGIVGCITGNDSLTAFAQAGLQEYINTAYFPDGTSADLKQRDALHYHISGLKPLISISVNLTKFDPAFDCFHYTAPSGASVQKSVEYMVPYALGEQKREEWANSTVALDKERAEAGLDKYQPGTLFNPKKAITTFEWASYYQPAWYEIVGNHGFTSTWVGLLNSPLVREKSDVR